MTCLQIAGRTLVGAAVALIAASPALAAKYCWKSNGRVVCVTSGSKPKDCKTKPCVITYAPIQGGSNKPLVVLERPAGQVAPLNDISRGLDLKTFDANRFSAPKALDGARAAPARQQ